MTTFEIFLNRTEHSYVRGYQPGDTLELVSDGVVLTDESEAALLEEVFRVYNVDHPEGYTERSLSVGDVVRINGRSFVCRAMGWERLHRQPDQPVLTLEEIIDEEAYRAAMEREAELIQFEIYELEDERYGYHGAGVEYYDDFPTPDYDPEDIPF